MESDKRQKKTRKTAISSVLADEFSIQEAIGGWRGIIESGSPTLIFLLVFLIVKTLWVALILSCALAGIFVLVRVLQKTSIAQSIAGFLGVFVGAFLSWNSGRASEFFITGILANTGYFLIFLISLIARRPIIGELARVLEGIKTTFIYHDSRFKRHKQVYYLITFLWMLMFGLRLLFQVPLYINNQVGPLGAARIVMGAPLFLLVAWISWILHRGLPVPKTLLSAEEITEMRR